MSRPPDGPAGYVPTSIGPRKKAALLIAIILLDLLQITFGGLSLRLTYRHSGYGRRGAWARPWNEDGVPGVAIFNGIISILTFGGHGLSELFPRHTYYSRRGILLAASFVLLFNWLSLVDAVKFGWHFLSFGTEGDRDAYWLGVWSFCILSVTVSGLVVTTTYTVLLGKAIVREEAEVKVGEMSETGPLLGSAVGTQPPTSGPTDAEPS